MEDNPGGVGAGEYHGVRVYYDDATYGMHLDVERRIPRNRMLMGVGR